MSYRTTIYKPETTIQSRYSHQPIQQIPASTMQKTFNKATVLTALFVVVAVPLAFVISSAATAIVSIFASLCALMTTAVTAIAVVAMVGLVVVLVITMIGSSNNSPVVSVTEAERQRFETEKNFVRSLDPRNTYKMAMKQYSNR